MTKENTGYNSLTDANDEFLAPPEVPVPDALDAMARELPDELEGFWIAKLVRSFAKANDMDARAAEDLFQEACLAACRATEEAERKNGVVAAFVKAAVRSHLTNLTRRHARRTQLVELAENGPRGEDADPNGRLIENYAAPDYHPSRNARIDAVRLAALIVSPAARRWWQAYRATNGSATAVAQWLGCGVWHVRRKLAPRARAEFKAAIALVKHVRKGGAQ